MTRRYANLVTAVLRCIGGFGHQSETTLADETFKRFFYLDTVGHILDEASSNLRNCDQVGGGGAYGFGARATIFDACA